MRGWSCIVVLVALVRSVAADEPADPHAEMAAALAAQADVMPAPIVLPARSSASRHAASESAVQRGIAPRAADEGARAADREAQGQAEAVARQAAAAAATAAGQQQATAAQQRAVTHPHGR